VNNEVKKVLFIVNKYAGAGFQPEVEGLMINACETRDIECTIEFTQSRGHATELAGEAAAKGFQCVIAVGGDGTVNEVAQGLVFSAMPMGIISRGSGNGLARHLGISLKLKDALTGLFDSRVMAMDTFTVNGKLSLNVSGIGFDGHIANLFGGKIKRGLLGYVKLTIQEYIQFKEFSFQLSNSKETIDQKAFIVAIGNSSQYGNNARIAPAASVCDGILHVTMLKKVPAHRADFIYAMFAGDIQKSIFCETLETSSLHIKTSAPVAYHIDGEPCGINDSFEIKILPSTLQVLVPNKPNHPRLV
jgi:YegS/Rv2252/BmrU family lipid kinase